jgi:hypothetical protein
MKVLKKEPEVTDVSHKPEMVGTSQGLMILDEAVEKPQVKAVKTRAKRTATKPTESK